MKKLNIWKNLPPIITIVADVALVIAVVFLMNHVQRLLNTDVQINLTEIVTQNRDVINGKLNLEINNLDFVASQLADDLKKEEPFEQADNEVFARVFLDYCRERDDDSLFIATADGTAYMPDASSLDISGRRYFRLAVDGIQNISDRIVSRADGEEMFVISVPLQYRGKIVGTVQRRYSPAEMYTLCSVSLFSSQGYMYVINSEGYILISSVQQAYNQESDNYFRLIYSQGNQEASRKLEADIRDNRSGFMETVNNGKKIFAAYTPIQEVHDWYLISCVATDAVSPNASIVIRLFYIILLGTVLIFGLSLLYFFSYKNKQQAALCKIAFVDTVTQGNTYNKFVVDLQNLLRQHPEGTYFLLSFDIDNFKYINSFYGFDFGDQILLHINETFAGKLHPGEMIARVSGDHFVVLLQDAEPERLDDLLSTVQNKEGGLVSFTAGLYVITDPTESINLMVDKASTAAQTAKGVFHKQVVLYSEQFDQQMIHNEQMKRAVEQALANSEIIPFFQPKVNVNTGELVGAEALARWRTSAGKLISPGEFIPICEKTGLIVELDMMVFEKTLQFLKRNLDAGVRCVPISVNFSRLHLPNNNFLDRMVGKLDEYGVPPALIEVELTESVIFENYEIIAQFADQLHAMGLLIAMDDFGSGYSSLNMLKDIPIDILKIDRAFLQDTANGDKQRIILSTISKMAEQLHINVVVEGVETKQNVEMMQEFGCHIAQGYYFARPMDEPDFEVVYREGALC